MDNTTQLSEEHFINASFRGQFVDFVRSFVDRLENWDSYVKQHATSEDGIFAFVGSTNHDEIKSDALMQQELSELHDATLQALLDLTLATNYMRSQPFWQSILRQTKNNLTPKQRGMINLFTDGKEIQKTIDRAVFDTIEYLSAIRSFFNGDTEITRQCDPECHEYMVFDGTRFQEAEILDVNFMMERNFVEQFGWPLRMYSLEDRQQQALLNIIESDHAIAHRIAQVESGYVNDMFPGRKLLPCDEEHAKNPSKRMRSLIDAKAKELYNDTPANVPVVPSLGENKVVKLRPDQ
jgi:hypothetical protein